MNGQKDNQGSLKKNRQMGGFRKKKSESSPNDFYPTPVYLVKRLLDFPFFQTLPTSSIILEPACGVGAISNEFKKAGFTVIEHDIATDNVDFLSPDTVVETVDVIVTNPPFGYFTDFVERAKAECKHVWMIGKTNFFGAHERNVRGIWKNLEEVYIFDRQVDYNQSELPDGKFKTGMLVTGWFHWNRDWTEDFAKTRVIDVQEGVFKNTHPSKT